MLFSGLPVFATSILQTPCILPGGATGQHQIPFQLTEWGTRPDIQPTSRPKMQELRSPGLILRPFAGTTPFTAKIDDDLCPQPYRFDGCEPTRKCRPNCDTVLETTENLEADGEMWSIAKKLFQTQRGPSFRMRDTSIWTQCHDAQISKSVDVDVNRRWNLNQGCCTFHQPSPTIDTGWFPTSFRQRNLIFNDGFTIPCNVTTIQHVVEQVHGLWFRLKQQLLSEFNGLGMSLPLGQNLIAQSCTESIKLYPKDVQQHLPSNTIGCSALRPVVHTHRAIDELPTSQSMTSIPFPHRRRDPMSGSNLAFFISSYVAGLPGQLSISSPWFLYTSNKAEPDDLPPPPPPEPSPTAIDQ